LKRRLKPSLCKTVGDSNKVFFDMDRGRGETIEEQDGDSHSSSASNIEIYEEKEEPNLNSKNKRDVTFEEDELSAQDESEK
jgi:hypothetical protein